MTEIQAIMDDLKKCGVTKWKLAQYVGVSWQTVHNWDKGLFSPTADKMELIKKYKRETVH